MFAKLFVCNEDKNGSIVYFKRLIPGVAIWSLKKFFQISICPNFDDAVVILWPSYISLPVFDLKRSKKFKAHFNSLKNFFFNFSLSTTYQHEPNLEPVRSLKYTFWWAKMTFYDHIEKIWSKFGGLNHYFCWHWSLMHALRYVLMIA